MSASTCPDTDLGVKLSPKEGDTKTLIFRVVRGEEEVLLERELTGLKRHPSEVDQEVQQHINAAVLNEELPVGIKEALVMGFRQAYVRLMMV